MMDLIGVGRVVGGAGGQNTREQDALAILMLQAFAGQRGAAAVPPHRKPLPRESPNAQISRPRLEAEHRVVDEERIMAAP